MLGLMGVLSYATARLAAKAGVIGYNRYTLVAVPVAGMPKMPRGFRVEEINAAHLQKHVIDVPADVQSARFAQGMVCLAAFNATDELVGVNWVGTRPFVEDEVHVCFCPPIDAGWDTGLWIKPEHRMGRGFAALWAGTARWLAEHGRRWSMSRIADYNLASIKSHQRMGAIIVGHITAIRLFRWQYMADGDPRMIRIAGDPAVMTLALPAAMDLDKTRAGADAIRTA
jgi:hypothetical protein